MPIILLMIILGSVLAAPYLPFKMIQILYTISLNIKEIILFLLPFVIFSLLFKSTITLSRGSTHVIFLILLLVCCSNFCSTLLSHSIGLAIYQLDLSLINPQETTELIPLWSLGLPNIIGNDKALFGGLFLGLILSYLSPKKAEHLSHLLNAITSKILQIIVSIIPVFVIGFILKLQYDGVVEVIVRDYTLIFLWIALSVFSYICLLYFLLSNGRLSVFLTQLKNMLPAAISGFSTMSSAASMPLAIIGASNNTSNKEIAKSVIPATVNIHLIGDCFAIPIFAYAIMKSFGVADPSFTSYLIFSFYFVLAKFSVAAIPGGGIIVMLPILEKHLGFTGEMMSLITALYILFDPVITSANVLGNGAFAKFIDRLLGQKFKVGQAQL